MEKLNKENALIWKATVEKLKEQVIQATKLSEALQLEVDTLKQEEEEDLIVAVLPPDAKVRVMNSVINQVGKAWDTSLAASSLVRGGHI